VLVAFIRATQGTWLMKVFEFFHLGSFITFIAQSYFFIIPLLIIGILSAYIRNWKWLLAIFVILAILCSSLKIF
jgi:membrane protein implicated in regulation of membrane protease activity